MEGMEGTEGAEETEGMDGMGWEVGRVAEETWLGLRATPG